MRQAPARPRHGPGRILSVSTPPEVRFVPSKDEMRFGQELTFGRLLAFARLVEMVAGFGLVFIAMAGFLRSLREDR
jgi:hypothetical protein